MSDYFVYTPLTANTVARAADVNTRFQGVSAGFDLLPPPLYIQEDRVTWSVGTGVANAYVATPSIPLTAYNTGTHISMQASATNTGPSTINVSGLGVKQIVRSDGTPLDGGDIVAGQILDLTYDGSAFRLSMAFADISPAGVAAKIAAAGPITINGLLTVNANGIFTGSLTAGSIVTAGTLSSGAITSSGNVTATGLTIGGQTLDAPTAFGISLVETADANSGRGLLGLGTMATQSAATYAPLASPTFTGTPAGPTAAGGTSTTQLATTAFVTTAITALSISTYAPLASPTFTGDPKAPTPATADNDTSIATTAYVKANLSSYAPLASPGLTGTPTAPTAAGGTNTTQLATTAFVQNAVGGIGGPYLPLTGGTLTGALTSTGSTITVQTPGAAGNPGYIVEDDTDRRRMILYWDRPSDSVALRRYAADGSAAEGVLTFQSAKATLTYDLDVTGNVLVTDEAFAVGWNGSLSVPTKNAVYDQMILKAPLASPALTGTPTAPTAGDGTSSTQIATTAFVQSVISAKANLASPTFTGTPLSTTPATADDSTKIATTAYVKNNLSSYLTTASAGAVYAPLASPALTGTPTAPTAAAGTSSTQIATTAFVQAEVRPDIQTAAGNSITPTFADDLVIRTGATGAITLNNPTGSAFDGHGITIRLKDNGTARAISYGSQYRAMGSTLPTTTVANKWTYIGMIWNSAETKWDVVAVRQEA